MNYKYYKNLIDRIYKVLCLCENNSQTYEQYVSTLCFELSANRDFAEVESIRFKLQALIINKSKQKEVRKTVFECISLVNKILNNSGV